MNYNFKVLNNLYKTINYINKLLINYPKKEIILKDNIERNNYELMECVFTYNINDTHRIKEKALKDLLVKLSMLDFYMKISHDKKIISDHQFVVIGKFLLEIRKMVFGIMKRNGENESDIK